MPCPNTPWKTITSFVNPFRPIQNYQSINKVHRPTKFHNTVSLGFQSKECN
ncbi:Hypothetical protein I595_179 [Croceitalea dokdonensis DOKDO 023]|uniref:Uncharacterized protein n=1 Tax=Croceitalea dokdonensis DOKDO 023 TaxID=1300341 RepID=A0A0N8H4G1_9FLAO|nr:Hypothetical protein I595_179 [Croceitalea dokdonensis DOKDO 023]